MTNRRVIVIESIYRSFASPHDIAVIDRMYAEGSKGPAIRKMAYAIRKEFERMRKELDAVKARRYTPLYRPMTERTGIVMP